MNVIYHGITLSENSSTEDLSNITNKNIDYFMIKCASSTDGKIKKDSKFDYFVSIAESKNIPYGVYYSTNSIKVKQIEEEADFIFNLLSDKKMQFPIYIEQMNTDKSKVKEITNTIVAFCGKAWYNKFYSGFRCTTNYLKNNLDFNRVRKYNFWLVCHSDRPGNPMIPFGMWEHTTEYRIDNTLNMFPENYCIQNYPKTIRQNNLNGY